MIDLLLCGSKIINNNKGLVDPDPVIIFYDGGAMRGNGGAHSGVQGPITNRAEPYRLSIS